MKFGAYAMPSFREEFGLTQGEYLRATLNHLARADELGFDSVWVNEHHFHQYGGMMPALSTMLAAVSQHTTRVRLGTSVVVLPLHHPLEVAEQLAVLDLLSGGRVELGIGRGFVAHDYEVLGVNYADAQERLMESIQVILKAWSNRSFSHAGPYYQLEEMELWPRPEQRPHPPIWMAASNSPKSFEYIGTQGYRLLTIGYLKPIAALAELTRIYRETWAAAGRAEPPTIGTHYHVVVAEDRAEARGIAESGLREHVRLNRASQYLSKLPAAPSNAGIDIEQLVDEGRLIAGDPDDCARSLRRMAEEIGCTEAHCLFQFGDVPFAVANRSMELFAAEVMPRVQQAELARVSNGTS